MCGFFLPISTTTLGKSPVGKENGKVARAELHLPSQKEYVRSAPVAPRPVVVLGSAHEEFLESIPVEVPYAGHRAPPTILIR
jgi:hypothetical protein